MNVDDGRFGFLLGQSPVCTQSPVKVALGPDLHRELRARYKLELGIDLMEDRCSNVFNCVLQGSGCIGRPLPLDNQIFKALKSSNCKVTTGNYKGHEVYLAKSITCVDCPFKVGCETACATQESYLKRSIRSDQSPKGSMLVNFDDYEAGKLGLLSYVLPPETEPVPMDYSWMSETLPMDCLTPQQSQVIEMIRLQGKTQVEVAGKLKISQQQVGDQLRLAETRLKTFGLARKIIKVSRSTPRRVKLYYINNLTEQEIADRIKVDQSNISRSLKKWRLENGIKE